MSGDCAIELVDVVKRFTEVTAVDHVSLQIRDGEFFSLLGPSGCGKTTSLRLIAGFEMPTEGDIYIGGQLQGYLPANQRTVNTVFQHYALFPHMTVFKNVSFGLEMQKVTSDEIRQRVGEALEMVHLSGMEQRKPKQLSGGQQQRVALARALVNHPKVLLLDEPLGALDLKLRKAMQVELKALQAQVGITFIYVTHDQEEALTMSDRIAVMDRGKMLQVGTPHEVYEEPCCRFVAEFIGESNYIEGKVVSLQNDLVEILIEPDTRIWGVSSLVSQKQMSVSLAFRPEKAQINTGNIGQQNRIPARVKDIIYMGSTTNYHLELVNGNSIKVSRQNTSEDSLTKIQKGDLVEVNWPIETSRVFYKESNVA